VTRKTTKTTFTTYIPYAYKQKVPPWYAVLWEAWRILVLQKYGFYLIPPNIFFKICLPNMDFNAASQQLVRFFSASTTFQPVQITICHI
jgi:hypothetical protein